MRRTPGLLLLGAPPALAAALFLFPSGPAASPAAPARSAAASDHPKPTTAIVPYQSVSSCSAASCHGSVGPGLEGAEQRVFAAQDRHANAYSVLFNDRSKLMAWNLYKKDGKWDKWEHARPQEVELCLKCHGPGGLEQDGQGFHATGKFGADGVGCESCHGNSAKWLSTHYLDFWKGLSPEQKADYGFVHTKDLVTRVEKCVECHVGKNWTLEGN